MPIPASAPVDRSLLRDGVYQRLRDAIVDGTFQPGEQLKDGELAEWLGVSRTPVREALLRLGGSGLVVALPGQHHR
jgi:DNA-binding GntR family transcriptional regulator